MYAFGRTGRQSRLGMSSKVAELADTYAAGIAPGGAPGGVSEREGSPELDIEALEDELDDDAELGAYRAARREELAQE